MMEIRQVVLDDDGNMIATVEEYLKRIKEQRKPWEELKKEWDDKCTYWKPDNSIKGRIKAKLYKFLLKLCERLNPSKDCHDKLVNDANRFMDDKFHKNFYDDKVGYIDLDNITKEEQDKLIQRGKEISNDLQ